ncbi:hypothetical protein BAE44_0007868, partial [Dichanthelium oligosanthes]
LPSLVPIPPGGPSDRGWQRSGVATRGGEGCNGHRATVEYFVWWRC